MVYLTNPYKQKKRYIAYTLKTKRFNFGSLIIHKHMAVQLASSDEVIRSSLASV